MIAQKYVGEDEDMDADERDEFDGDENSEDAFSDLDDDERMCEEDFASEDVCFYFRFCLWITLPRLPRL